MEEERILKGMIMKDRGEWNRGQYSTKLAKEQFTPD